PMVGGTGLEQGSLAGAAAPERAMGKSRKPAAVRMATMGTSQSGRRLAPRASADIRDSLPAVGARRLAGGFQKPPCSREERKVFELFATLTNSLLIGGPRMSDIATTTLGRTGVEVTKLGFGAMELRGAGGFFSCRHLDHATVAAEHI